MVEALIYSESWFSSYKDHVVLREYMDEVEALNDSKQVVSGKIINLIFYLMYSFVVCLLKQIYFKFMSLLLTDDSQVVIEEQTSHTSTSTATTT